MKTVGPLNRTVVLIMDERVEVCYFDKPDGIVLDLAIFNPNNMSQNFRSYFIA